MSDTNPRRYRTAGDVLNGLREQLRERTHDDMTLLLKIFKDLKTLDTNKMSPHDAAHWMIQEETKQEKRITELATQAGFNRGLVAGLFGGIILCIFIWALLIC